MEETRRFLRYVIPGLIFIVEVTVYLFLSAYNQFKPILRLFIYSISDKTGTGIGAVVAAFLTSGGLGYLFSNIYYAIHNLIHGLGSFRYFKWLHAFVIDHRPLLYCAEERKWIKLVTPPGKMLTTLGAWRIVTALWKSRVETSTRIKSADHRMDGLADILHGLGASVAASLLAIPFWLYIHNKLKPCSWPWQNPSYAEIASIVLSVSIVIIFVVNYIIAAKNVQSIVRTILSEELPKGWRLEIDVDKCDLTTRCF